MTHDHEPAVTSRPWSRSRRAARSLGLTVAVVVAIPLAVGVVLLGRGVGQQRRVVHQSVLLADRLTLLADTTPLYAPLTVEVVSSTEMCVSNQVRDAVRTSLGYDWAPYLSGTRHQLDQALTALAERHAATVVHDGRRLADVVDELSATLAEQRAVWDQGCTSPDAITKALDEVDAVADGLLHLVEGPENLVDATSRLHALYERALLLAMVMDAVADESRAVATALSAVPSSFQATSALESIGRAESVIEAYAGLVADDPDAAERWSQLRTTAATSMFAAQRHQIEAYLLPEVASPRVTNGLDADRIRARSHLVLATYDRLAAFGDYAVGELSATNRAAIAARGEARQLATVLTVALVAGSLLVLGLVVLVITRTIAPLRRLTERVHRLGNGETGEPLPLRGPTEVRDATATYNAINHLMVTFEQQLRAAAEGTTPDPSLLGELPGALGASVRASVARLAALSTRLQHTEALSSAIVASAVDAIWTVDDDGRIVSANQAAERLTGIGLRDQLDHHLPTLLGGRVEVDELEGDVEIVRSNGTTAHLHVSRSAIPHIDAAGERGPVATVFARDVSEQKRFEQRLAFQARYDTLTGLPNRLAAFEHLDALLARPSAHAGQLAVLFIDLDGFKSVNDSRGHASGDRLLQIIARRLRSTLRGAEFVARLGGDEFLIVMEHASHDSAVTLGERTLHCIGQPCADDDELLTVTASIGIAIGTAGELDSLELVRQADVAVYRAKEQGRGRLAVFDETLQAAVEANAEVELALRHAISDGELRLWYQPVLDLTDDQPWGVEALVRWERPGVGLVQPDRFIPVAERSNLIVDLGRWVLHEACRTLASWQLDPARAHLHIAVNISGRHFTEADLVTDVDNAIAATGADPHLLDIELTETHLLADLARTNAVLDELRSRGIDIAVDDFGTGYSSMTYLRQLRVDTIKIDRLFTARIEQSGYDRTIVDVLLQLGQTLHLAIVAEGVETTGQLEILRDQGCDRAQGYLFARPLPADRIDEWLTDRVAPVVVSPIGRP